MKPAPFDYQAPASLEQALSALAEHGEAAKLLAGGQSLIPAMNFRVVQPALLIDLNRLEQLRHIGAEDGSLVVGAMTTQRQLEREPTVAEKVPLLAQALPHIAHPQIRNRGTLGGSLAHADPAAELPVVAVATRARIRARSAEGERWIPAESFFQGMFVTDLSPVEMVVEVAFPDSPARTGWSFQEVSRRRGDYAMMGVAAMVSLSETGQCTEVRLVYLNAGDGPVQASRAVQALLGREPQSEALEAAARIAAEQEIDPLGNLHASVSYQRHLARVLTRRALGQAAEASAQAGYGHERRADRVGRAGRRGMAMSGATHPIRVTVNDQVHERRVEPRLLLSDFLRHALGLTGTHVGCEHGVCGACTVLLDGLPVRSCLMLAVQADGQAVTTVEGLAAGPEALHPLQQAFWEKHGLQCGFCTPGFLITLLPFLQEHPQPSETEIREAISGNLCRCTGYQHIVQAVQHAAELMQAQRS